jgi:predicted nucleotidyltransferase component of viral defense system
VPDRRLVEKLAEDLGTSPGLIEKDWHVVRAIGVIAGADTAGMMPAFSGGTSLSKGWELIKRFSEDIDFGVF